MAFRYKNVALAGALFAQSAIGLNTNNQVAASIDYGSFSNPSAQVRPRFRYWIPDASVNLDVVADDFAKVKNVGMGGLELLGYYLYGNYPSIVAEGGPVPVDWTKYGWGTEAWKDLTDVALKATKENGLIMDFALGPNQGAGVPAKPDDEGIMWYLNPFNVSVPIGGSFNDVLPGWGSGKFVSASTALVITQSPANYSAQYAWIGPFYYNGTRYGIAASSLEDVTDQVDADSGRLNLQLPSGTDGIEYQVFAYYETRSTYLEQASPMHLNTTVVQSPVQSYVENGSWVVDHFSSKGAQLIIDFWEQHLLGGETRDLIKEVGNFGWEDSMEIGAGALSWWTPGLLSAFNESRGYQLNKYLPLIFSYNTEHNGPLASPNRYYTDESDLGQAHVNDYWQQLTELNRIYLETLSNWTNSALDSQFSAQVVYNLPMDMLANIPAVDAPECESLGFGHLIDAYRQFAGPANLAGKRIISSELGAQPEEAYGQTLPELIWDTKRSIAGSINNFVYHGFPYTGEYPNTTWPGYTTFTYRFSNMHGPRQPSWEYYDDFMNWTARVQWMAQSGVPKLDLAFWLKKDQYFSVPSAYEPNDLQSAGYTYEYLSPDNFDLPHAVVGDAVFAPERQAFKALILRANDTLTVGGVQNLSKYAHAGLPIVFSGGIPQNLTGHNQNGTTYVRSLLSEMASLENVHVVPYDNLAASLHTIGIQPRTRVSADRTWYTYWREDANASVTYVYLYNDAWDSELGQGASTGSITFETSGVPYEYDAWTGGINPILAYQQTNTTTTLSFSLAGNQSAIIGFHHNETAPQGVRPISLPSEIHSATKPSQSSNIIVMKAGNTTTPLLLSNGTTISLPVPATAPIQISNWSLVIESWSPPPDLEADQTQASISNLTAYNLTSLIPWNQISEDLRDVSGRGFYTSYITWDKSSSPMADVGAMLDLGALINTARVWVNGHQLPPLDPTHAVSDIGEFLIEGENRIDVVVSTTLGNVLRRVWKDVKTSGTKWLGPEPVEQQYGLVGNVTVYPYLITEVAL